jgi:hypothetical protein
MQMQIQTLTPDTARYAKCVEVSKRIRWDIDRDVIRERDFDYSLPFLPDGLSFADRLDFLGADEKRQFSQIQGRSYANIFGLVERFIGAKVLDVSRDHWLGDQTALEALVRFSDEELKHQELFRRLDRMMDAGMPAGYSLVAEPNAVATAVLGKSTWAVLGLTCHIELFTQLHYRSSIEPEANIDPLWKDVFLYHWREESQHAILDELEWQREDARLSDAERDHAVDELIELVGAVDSILQAQAQADSHYFLSICGRSFDAAQATRIHDTVLGAYRWQYILSGVNDPRFARVIGSMISEAQGRRIAEALAPLVN